ncbi:MAG: hypothetical protein ABW221_06680 [Vicinamibacteria bacterium]
MSHLVLLLLLAEDPLATPKFPAGLAGAYTQTRPDAACTLTIEAKGGYALACGDAPRATGRLRVSGPFIGPHADSDAWSEYEAVTLAHLPQEKRPPQVRVAFMLTAVVRDGRTFLVDFSARRAFCGEDTPGTVKDAAGRIFRKDDTTRPFGTPSADYCSARWQPTL